MIFEWWFLIVGAVFLLMALSSSLLSRLPLSTSMLYLAVGIGIGPYGLGLLSIDPILQSDVIERITEIVVLVSLFCAGLKLVIPWRDPLTRLPVILASWSMLLTIGMITVVGTLLLGLPLGAAVLLGAVLAPTDPVLASDVQVTGPRDRDRLRFTLTGEAGLNDGTAFPFVILGLGLLGLEDLGSFGWRWLAVDVIWAISGGLLIGAVLGSGAGHVILYLRRQHKEAVGLDDFLALGLIAFAYGAALLLHTYGFLAVFAAGLALRWVESRASGTERAPEEVLADVDTVDPEELATRPETAPAYMAQTVLSFTEQLERIGEVAVMLLIGAMLSLEMIPTAALWFVPLLLLVIRPVAVNLGLIRSGVTPLERGYISWFGIRGIGSVYYLMYVITHEVPEDLALWLTGMTLAVVATSIVVHGISVTPLMGRYEEVQE
jgi:NhaP-type Na+/H+ or K+/H+ antiporter